MIRHITILGLVLFLSNTFLAAQSKNFTITQAVLGQNSEFTPERLNGLAWRPSTKSYTYIQDKDLIEVDVQKGTLKVILTLDKFNENLKQMRIPEARSLRQLTWVDNTKLSYLTSNLYCEYDVERASIHNIINFDESAQNHDLDPTRKLLAYSVDNNLFVVSETSTPIAVTSDKNLGIVNGQSVHRNEFGIDKGTFWSPTGKRLAFYRMDQSMVTDYPLVNIDNRIAIADPIKYPMAGMKSHEVSVGVYNVETTNTVWLKTGEPNEQYLTNIAWSPDEQSIYIAVINREQNHMWLNQYSSITGEFVKTLFEEKHDKYVEPQNPMIFLKSKPDHFLWQSQRDGYNHVYLYKNDGTLVKQITKGEGMVTSIIGTDAREQFLYFMSTKQSPIECHLYRVDLKNGDERRLTLAAGTHRILLNTEAGFYIDTWSSTTIPNRVELYQQNGKFVKQLLAAKNPYNDYKMGSMEMVSLTANDGKTSLYGRVIKPIEFDSTKKYPVIVYVYGGPHTQLVTNSWLGGARLWEYYMAQKGYVMFTIDNRGSSNRSLEFENAIHRNIGVNELADQLTGIQYLKGLSYVDTARIGVHGWSYGGFMTVSMMLKASETFKVGVAGGPVIDWSLYEVMYGERYMDTPEENPEGYSNSNLKNYVKNLKGKLLIVHGDIDATVVPQHSFGFLHECVKQGVQVDFFIYPRHEHNVRGRDRVHLMQKVTNYFDDYL